MARPVEAVAAASSHCYQPLATSHGPARLELDVTWPGILFWLLIIVGVFSRGPFLLYVFFAAGSFGSLQMLPGEAVGGVNLLPQSVVAVFYIGKVLLQRGNPARAIDVALDPAQLGPLFLFLAYGFLSAYAMPRLFMRSVEVIPVSPTVPWPVLLEPTAANITQSGYMAISIGMALALTLSAGRPDFQRHYLLASLLGGGVVIATGLGDMVLTAAGLGDLLEPFRNATYAFLVDVEVLGGKRIVGLMPEASAYGSICIAAAASLALLRPCFPDALRRYVAPAIILGLIVMAMLSTSSTAYVGFAVFAMVFAANWLRRSLDQRAPARDELKWEAFAVIGSALAVLIMITLSPALLDPVYAMLDSIVFKKTESESFAERSMWTRVGMEAFFATKGIGVGLGSDRTSNWFVAILSNTGVIGAALLGWFIVRLFLRGRPTDPYAAEYFTALKFSLVPGFIMAALAGTTPDIGVGVGATFGMIVGLGASNPPPPFASGAQSFNQRRARAGGPPS